jgi:pseudouridine-5'-phosphate glycosidase
MLELKIKAEVKNAIKNNKPLVALESTIISHGLPYPENKELAISLEEQIRESGATPATIGVIKGQVCVGLENEEIEHLAKEGRKVLKLSAKDIPWAVLQKKDGATTVAATMKIAALSNIKFFATGGIGGVHRGVENSWDISADLMEFRQSPVMVISAGAKAILDLPKTLEYLETNGIMVVGYKTKEFPAFYSRTSGINLNFSAETPSELAQLFKINTFLFPNKGILVANPIPQQEEIPAEKINPIIENAIQEAQAKKITGKEVTPFLLKRLVELTEGESLRANLALVKNNVRLATEIAKEFAKIE